MVRRRNKYQEDEYRDEEGSNARSPVGLSNLGNTCFFNSVMQCLIQTRILITTFEEEIDTRTLVVDEEHLDDLEYAFPPRFSLTTTFIKFIKSCNQMTQNFKRRVVSPQSLFNEICKKSPRFRGYQQQDSQELLRTLLDDMKTEEVKKKKLGLLRALNLEKLKAAEATPSLRETVKAYWKVLMKEKVAIDLVFQGSLISSVMCDECGTITNITEDFLDLSLPILEEKGHAPNNNQNNEKRGRKNQKSIGNMESVGKKRLTKKQQKKKSRADRRRMRRSKQQIQKEDELGILKVETNSSSSVEDEKCVLPLNQTVIELNGDTVDALCHNGDVQHEGEVVTGDEEVHQNGVEDHPPANGTASDSEKSTENNLNGTSSKHLFDEKQVIDKLSKLQLMESEDNEIKLLLDEIVEKVSMADNNCNVIIDETESRNWSSDDEMSATDDEEKSTNQNKNNNGEASFFETPQKSIFTSMCRQLPETCEPHYNPLPQECSVESCLHKFTMAEILTGTNKFGCENCTKNQTALNAGDGKMKTVYCNATKMLLVESLPPILTIHLKRFHQVGYNLRKINRKVTVSSTLRMGPFCATNCMKTVQSSIYKLYGIVEHVGSLSRGHYTSYINMNDQDGNLTNDWFHISDAAVSKTTEEKALNCNAYLLFYKKVPL